MLKDAPVKKNGGITCGGSYWLCCFSRIDDVA